MATNLQSTVISFWISGKYQESVWPVFATGYRAKQTSDIILASFPGLGLRMARANIIHYPMNIEKSTS